MTESTQPIGKLAAACLLAAACSSPDPDRHPIDGTTPVAGTPDPTAEPDDPSCPALTDYPGDCFQLDPPAAGEGFQVRYGPNDYDNPDEVAAFVLPPGGEEVDCVYRVLDNAETAYFQRYTTTSRPGMHHIILYAARGTDITDGSRDACQMKNEGARLLGVLHGGINGARDDYPPSGEVAPENAGLAQVLDPQQAIAYELHAVNPLNEPLLRESWTNFYAMAPADVTELEGQVVFNGGLRMDIPPQTTQVIDTLCAAMPDPIRVTELFGHMHAHGARFSAFKTTFDDAGNQSRQLIYESYDWFELDRAEFNSVVQNPAPVYESGLNGAFSGILNFQDGDRLDYECEIQNTEDFDLRYSIGAYTAEMCNLFGAYAPDIGRSWTCRGDN
jgi:hypothetical protein